MNGSTADDRIVLAITTVPDAEAGARIGRALVEERIAACVTRVPEVVSIYRFEGSVHEDPESLLLIKTTRARVPDLERRLAELHPYQVPELLIVDPSAVGAPYADWVRSVTG
jgi:periplasmic divalent cation tolerance protein